MMKNTLIKKIVDSYEETDTQPLCNMLNALKKAELFDEIQQGLAKDEDTRIHDEIEIGQGGVVYINGILCKSVSEVSFEREKANRMYISTPVFKDTTQVTITFKVPKVTIK